ncbi:MAG: glycosyltransferase [Proteobacteria bacterium]|nr:glycosyltransferase [Pseudomonadota bacterium]
MNILHIYKSYYPFTIGGIEMHIQSLTASLRSKNIECSILTTQKAPEVFKCQINNTPVFYYPSRIEFASCPISFKLLRDFNNLIKDYDILHYHFPWPFADFTRVLTSVNKPIVVTYHSDILRQKYLKLFYYPLMRFFLNRSNIIIASSQNYLQSSSVLKKYSSKVKVIPFGLDKSKYPIPEMDLLKFWKDKVGENFFLFVGVLRYYKGLDFLLEAVKNTNIPVVIAGSGPEETKLAKIKQEKNINNVRFVGKITDLDKAALYQLSRATVVPSHLRAEAFCISLLESLIYNRPAISTELNTGTSFVNQHNLSGLVVPPANPEALRQAMLVLLNNETLYQQLKTGTALHYHQYFSINNMRDHHIQLYEGLLRR